MVPTAIANRIATPDKMHNQDSSFPQRNASLGQKHVEFFLLAVGGCSNGQR